MIGRHSPRPALAIVLAGLLAPSALAGEAGTISGTLKPPGWAVGLAALDRASGKSYPGKIDPATGRFTIEGLPRDARYDVAIDGRDGSRLEGIDLKVPPSDFVEEQPLAPEDVATLRRQVLALNKFEDQLEVLAISGNAQHAAVLINKVRTRPFVNSKPGEVVWRAELWHFERPEETWVKSQDELFLVLYRKRIPKEEYARTSIAFDPALGGIAVAAEKPDVELGTIGRPAAGPGIRIAGEAGRVGAK